MSSTINTQVNNKETDKLTNQETIQTTDKLASKDKSDRLWSQRTKELSPYIPGEQPKHDDLCKLNTNENPFPPSAMVVNAIESELREQATALRLYPAPESDDLRQQLASNYGLDTEQVFVGNGSDEVLGLVFACFFIKDLPLLTPDISYSFYPVYAQTFAVDLIKIPLREDFSVGIDDYQHDCGGIIIANPNAPTGLLLSLADIELLCQRHANAVIVIDEAYIDFASKDDIVGWQKTSAINLINKYDNLLVTQTFSKSRSLAGLRVGMAFANPSLIEALTRMKNSFNSYPIDRLAQVGATASLQDNDYFNYVCEQVVTLRTELADKLEQMGFESLESHANFIFTKPPTTLCSGNAAELAEKLREQGIIVRYFNKPRISDYLRITVGTQAQNQRLLEALSELQIVDLQINSTEEKSSNELITDNNNSDNGEDINQGIRFFLKCFDSNSKLTKTYRFNSQQELTQFAQLSSQRGYSILDTHITFYDIDLVFTDLSDADDSVIDAKDVSMAENGDYWIKEWQE